MADGPDMEGECIDTIVSAGLPWSERSVLLLSTSQ